MCTSNWTYGDLAELTSKATEHVFCANCQVAPALSYDDYCAACLDELIEKMAEQWREDTSMSIYR